MIEAIVLSNRPLDSIYEWQKAITKTGYCCELNTAIPIAFLDGYIPVRWKSGKSRRNITKTGFECRYLSPENLPIDSGLMEPLERYTNAFAMGWEEDAIGKFSVRIAAASYAKATDGIVLVRGKGSITPDDLLSVVEKDNEYDFLPTNVNSEGEANGDEQHNPYRYDERPNTTIQNIDGCTLNDLRDSGYAVLVGRNNSGKSFVLKALTEHWGKSASYLGPARYQNFNLLTHFTPTEDKQGEKWRQFSSSWANESQNLDNSPINLQQSISELSNDQRSKLKEIIKELLGADLDFRFTIDNNEMSQKYVSCNGHNISFTSSGFRLIITIVTVLLDEMCHTVLVDEPELGISPEAQGILADFFLNKDLRIKYFPHIKSLILATHSTVFLDRNNIRNNYAVDKSGDNIVIRRIEDQRDFNKIHFLLLGNRFETLYLPSAIFLVEGKTDHLFVERVLSLKYPQARFSVVSANTDSQIKHYLHITKGLLNGIQKSPYQDRIFVILDSTHAAGLSIDISNMGISPENIVEWSKNGIEYVYPEHILKEIFGSGAEIAVRGDIITRNGISLNKNELSQKVCGLMRPDTELHPEFRERLMDRIEILLK